MKKVIVLALSAAMLSLGVSSCKKTSKRKLSNDWTIVKMDFNSKSFDSDGSRSNYTEKIDNNSISLRDEDIDASGNTSIDFSTGTVSEAVFIISKDGTWERNVDYKYIYFDGTSSQKISKEKGTWYFLGKNKGEKFKKNEKVVFYLNESSSKTISFDGSVTSVSEGANTYKGSDEGYIYTVVESKRKSLKLELSSNEMSSGNYGTDKWEVKLVYELEQK